MCLVDLATGRLSLVEKDFALDGLIPLRLERSYRSTNIWRSDLGFGWSHNFGVRLWPQEDGTQLVFRGADGRRVIVPFPEKDKPAEALAEGVMIQIVPARQIPWPQLKSAAAEGLLVVQAAGFPSMLFEARRLRELYPLRGLADRSGNLVHITPTNQGLPARADDPHGRSIVFWRDDHGRLEQISLQPSPKAERISLVRYQYDQRGDLSAVHDAAGVRHYEYDSAHRLTSHRDRTGAACLTTYDAQGRCIRSGQPGGTQQRTYSYDPEHFQTTVTDSLGHSRVYEFNKDERVVRTVDSDGGESKFDYDVENRLVCVTNQAGGQTVICFDAQGAPAGKVAPDGSASGIITDDKGQIIHEISCAGASNGYKRDELGRVVEAIRAGRGTVKIAYTAQGEIEMVTTPLGRKVALKWSSDRRMLTESDELGIVTQQQTDALGRVISFMDASGAVTRYTYDAAGHLSEIIHPDQTRRNYQFDPEGRITQLTDEAGRTTQWRYDTAGNCIAVTRPDGKVVTSVYDSEKRLMEVREPAGATHQFKYTARGLMHEQTTTDGRTLQYQHDPTGRITGVIEPGGASTLVKLDIAGRISEVTYPDRTVKTVQHRCDANWIHVELAGHEIARELNSDGQALREQQDEFMLNREFGDAGQLLSATDSFGRRVSYEYDPAGRVSAVQVAQGRWIEDVWEPVQAIPLRSHSFEYDRVGNLTAWKMPGDKLEQRKYDKRRRLVEQVVSKGQRVILQRSYQYDPTGRAVAITELDRGRREFRLDVLGRLVGVSDNGKLRSFSYSQGDDLQFNVNCDQGHRPISVLGMQLEYDQRGFVARRRRAGARSDEFAYWGHGLLKEARLADGTRSTYEYDPHQRLVKIASGSAQTRYFWDDESLWALQRDQSSPVFLTWTPKSYSPIEQSQQDRHCTVHVDHCHKIQELIDDDGNTAWRNNSGEWGGGRIMNPAAPPVVECPFGFPGQIFDCTTGFYYNRRRFYYAEGAHYLTPDPVGIYGGTNPYRYPQDPINLIDPSGLTCRGKADDPTLYRGDSRPPSDICAQGFQPSNPNANLTCFEHVEGVPSTGSNWISTTYDAETAERFAQSGVSSSRAPPNAQPWVYVIDNPNCGTEVDCDPEVQAKYGNGDSEKEIAFNGGLPPNRILGYYHAGAGPSSFQACP